MISCTCLPLNPQGDFYRQSLADFVPFLDLSVWDAQRAKNHCRVQGEACFVVQIQDGQIYILDEKTGFQSRDLLPFWTFSFVGKNREEKHPTCGPAWWSSPPLARGNRLTMQMLQRVAAKFGPLPDAEFVVDTSDGYSHVEGPIFVIAKFPSWPWWDFWNLLEVMRPPIFALQPLGNLQFFRSSVFFFKEGTKSNEEPRGFMLNKPCRIRQRLDLRPPL